MHVCLVSPSRWQICLWPEISVLCRGLCTSGCSNQFTDEPFLRALQVVSTIQVFNSIRNEHPADLFFFFSIEVSTHTGERNKQRDGSLSYVHILWHPSWTAVVLPGWAVLLQLPARAASRMWLNACKLTYTPSGPPFPGITRVQTIMLKDWMKSQQKLSEFIFPLGIPLRFSPSRYLRHWKILDE